METQCSDTQDQRNQIAIDAVRQLLITIGEDPDREGLIDTPKRVVKALQEMTKGQEQLPSEILARTFGEPCDEMVVVRNIPFTSLCEHHMLVFRGTAHVGYIPSNRVVGLSKIPRLVDCFANRLQIQERLTDQVAEAIEVHLEPLGVGVIMEAEHSCMACRGVQKSGASMVTSSMRGLMKSDHKARSEFMAVANR